MLERTTMADESLRTAGEPLAARVDEEDHVDGPADAPVMLVLYGDYE